MGPGGFNITKQLLLPEKVDPTQSKAGEYVDTDDDEYRARFGYFLHTGAIDHQEDYLWFPVKHLRGGLPHRGMTLYEYYLRENEFRKWRRDSIPGGAVSFI